jgi:hypothetical protein
MHYRVQLYTNIGIQGWVRKPFKFYGYRDTVMVMMGCRDQGTILFSSSHCARISAPPPCLRERRVHSSTGRTSARHSRTLRSLIMQLILGRDTWVQGVEYEREWSIIHTHITPHQDGESTRHRAGMAALFVRGGEVWW